MKGPGATAPGPFAVLVDRVRPQDSPALPVTPAGVTGEGHPAPEAEAVGIGGGSVRIVLQVLVDADNLHRARLAALVLALPEDAVVTAAGSPRVLGAVDWPAGTTLLPRTGWQRADLELAEAYQPDEGPLILATGDGDFAQLGRRHPGHVLVVSDAPSAHLRAIGTVLDPVHDGAQSVREWIRGARSIPRFPD